MSRRSDVSIRCVLSVWVAWLGASCDAVLKLDDFQVADAAEAAGAARALDPSCRVQRDCAARVGAAEDISFCTRKNRCASLTGGSCRHVAGPRPDADSVLIGTLFASTGPDGAAELARQRAVELAVQEIDSIGGVAATPGAAARKLVLVACDAAEDVDAAIAHLVGLGASAVIGLGETDVLLRAVQSQTAPAGVLTFSTAIAPEAVNSLLDADLMWLAAPTVEQRGPVTLALLSGLERRLAPERAEPLRLAVLVPSDSAGRAVLSALRSQPFQGAPLAALERQGGRVRIDRHPKDTTGQAALVAAYREFAPDIVLVAGVPDVLTTLIAPLELGAALDHDHEGPHYVLGEEAKGTELLRLAQTLPALRGRIHGVGSGIGERNRAVFEGFRRRYLERFADQPVATPRVAAAYDATYALAYAVAGVEPRHELGGRLAQVLRVLELPEQSGVGVFDVGPAALAEAAAKQVQTGHISVHGAANDLHWDALGSLAAGSVESWCLVEEAAGLAFGGGALRYDLLEQQLQSRAASCDPWLEVPAMGAAPLDGRGANDAPEMGIEPAQESSASQEPSSPQVFTTPEVSRAASSSESMTEVAKMPAQPQGGAGGMAALGSAGADAAHVAADGGGSGAAAPRVPASIRMACGSQLCSLDQEQCCVSVVRASLSGPMDGDLSCRPSGAPGVGAGAAGASGVAAPACAFSLRCGSDADCPSDQICCAGLEQASCKSVAACTAELGRRLACKSRTECAAGMSCCLHGNGDNMLAYTECEASCGLASGSARVCDDDSECLDDSTSNECNKSARLPILSVCWPRL